VGAGIRQGAALEAASVLDVTPTILYLMGLPVARDMEGRALVELLDPAAALGQPVSFIPSYESLAVAPATAPLDLALPPLPEEVP
jgi:arylsulfatase A-like enzyme